MTKTALTFFWIIWLIDVLMALLAYRQFIMGMFGQYAAPNAKYVTFWVFLLGAGLAILVSSVYFKNHSQPGLATIIASIPLVLALPYALYIAAIMLLGGQNTWR